MNKANYILSIKNHKVFSLIIALWLTFSIKAQLYFPNENYYHSEIERLNLNSDSITYFQKHLSSKPLLDSKTNSDSIYSTSGKYYYWITQKLFKENFIIFKGEDFWCSIDPIIDAELGTDLGMDSLSKLYWNTRGIRVQAKFYDKVAFTTSVYETQAIVPEYQSVYFNKHGEYRPTPQGYKQEHGYIPMYGRSKPFKVTGYDFAFAEGNLSIAPNKWVNFQLGNGNQFIGDGYRSLFLSDFSGNYPFFKTELFAFNGKLQYNAIYASLTNPYRLSIFSTPEATFERKIGVFHYLDYAITEHLNISLFEGSNWRSTDSTGSHPPDYMLLNPVIGANSLIKGSEDQNYNSIFGLSGSYVIQSNKIYSQLVIDNGKLAAYQIGIKSYNLFITKLDMRIEYNHAEQNTYLSENKRYNYSHNNLPLAHPYDNGFDELIGEISYQKGRFFFSNKTVFSARYVNDSLNIGIDILQPKTNFNLETQSQPNIFYNQFEVGYRFNKNYNFQAVLGYLYREENHYSNPRSTNYVYLGIRTRLRNKTLDW